MSPHLSTFALDALALDALAPPEREAAEAHLAACERCRADRDAGAAARAHFTVVVLPRTVPRPRRRWAWFGVPALAAAVILCVVMWHAPAATESPVLGVKGGPALQIFVAHEDSVFALQDGETLAAGDRLRFVAEPNGARYLLVASIDGAPAPAAAPRRALPATIAKAVGKMMAATCDIGSAAKSFGKHHEIRVAGKTGTLARTEPFYMEHSWFVGYAPYEKPEIVVSVLLGNAEDWHLHGHEAARRMIDQALHASSREKDRATKTALAKHEQW